MRRPWAAPLIPLYAAGVGFKSLLHDRGMLKSRSLAKPAISVGSLSAGGAGKTPLVLMLGKLLADHGLRADVLSLGYGRTSDAVEEVSSPADAARFGDEPTEIAASGLRVFVGRERYEAGLLAESSADPADLHLLDDGFQHRRLARQMDIVLLTAEDARDNLLPGGNLRERLDALWRADVLVLRAEEAAHLIPLVRARTQAEIWIAQRTLVAPPDRPSRPFVFCGIARPQDFFAMVARLSAPAGTALFPDHHRYTFADVQALIRLAQQVEADGFCLTAKDATKLQPVWIEALQSVGPLWTAKLSVTLQDPESALASIRRHLSQERKR